MKWTRLIGLLLATAIAPGCTAMPHSTQPTSGLAVSATAAAGKVSSTPSHVFAPSMTASVATSHSTPISADMAGAGLEGVHWVLTSFQRGQTVTDVKAFTPVLLELTASHFTVDTGISVFLFHYTADARSLLLGRQPQYGIGHGGYTRELGPAPLLLNDALQTAKTLRYAVGRTKLTLTAADGLVLNFRSDGPATMHYWSEPDNGPGQ